MPKQNMLRKRHIRPDVKGRIGLGKLAHGVSSFEVSRQPDGRIVLRPMVEIPAREKWLLENRIALEQVQKGLEQSSRGELVSRGSFAAFAEDDEDS